MPRSVYARIQDVRDELGSFPEIKAMSDARVLTRLERAADTIDRLTDQFFGPKREHFYRDGKNGRIVLEPRANKIIEVETLNLVLPDHTTFTLSPQVYVVYDRMIRLRRGETGLPSERAVKDGGEAWTLNNYSKTRREITLPDELHNVEVKGTFGWLEPSVIRSTVDPAAGKSVVASSKEVTLLTADVNVGDTVLRVANTGSFQIDDTLHLDPLGANFWVIVGGVFKWIDLSTAPLASGDTSLAMGNASQATVGDRVTISDGTTSVVVVVTAIVGSTIHFAAVTLAVSIMAAATMRADPPALMVVQWTANTLEPLIPGGTSVKIDNAAAAQIGDVVLIDDGNTQTSIVVSGVDLVNGRILFAPCVMQVFNALSPGSISVGAQVVASRTNMSPGVVLIDPCPFRALQGTTAIRWGRVPRDIREVAIRVVAAQRKGMGDNSLIDRYRTKSEKTDNYQYENFAAFTKLGNLYSGTGDPVADSILSRFRAPPTVSWV